MDLQRTDEGRSADVVHNLAVVRARIESAGGDLRGIRIVAVTKGHPAAMATAALQAGLHDLGENYADELTAKADELGNLLAQQPAGESSIRWHFQGRIQTNKINRLRPHVWLWQTIDSAAHVAALATRVPGAAVMVQVDFSEDPGRGGVSLASVPALVGVALDAGLDVRGLMTVAPLPGPGVPSAAEAFVSLSKAADRLQLQERSMGMSDDLEDAVRAGSTMIRIGGALFGPRTMPRA